MEIKIHYSEEDDIFTVYDNKHKPSETIEFSEFLNIDIDKDKNIVRALGMLGFSMTSKNLELILNVVDFVKEKGGNTTIHDLTELQECVESLYKD